MYFERIPIDAQVKLGKHCMKGTRITAEFITDKPAEGANIEWLSDVYSHIKRVYIFEAPRYVKPLLANEEAIEAKPAL